MSAILGELQEVIEQLSELRMAERTLVHNAKRSGATWDDIGKVYGITRQAAYDRFGRMK